MKNLAKIVVIGIIGYIAIKDFGMPEYFKNVSANVSVTISKDGKQVIHLSNN